MNVLLSDSPLAYAGHSSVLRVTLVDPTIVAASWRDTYFAPHCVGAASFIDYSVDNSRDLHVRGRKIHYMTTRADLRRLGYGSLLLEHFMLRLERDTEAAWVDFGSIMHDAMEKMFLRWRRLADEGKYTLRVYGKL